MRFPGARRWFALGLFVAGPFVAGMFAGVPFAVGASVGDFALAAASRDDGESLPAGGRRRDAGNAEAAA